MAKALIIVDFQNDFTPGGALAVPRRRRDRPESLYALAASPEFGLVVATRDWHPPDHGSFAEHGGPWPEALRGRSPTARQLHPALDAERVDVVVDKGHRSRHGGLLGLRRHAASPRCWRNAVIDEVTVVGLATDYCVPARPRSTPCRPGCG